MKSKILLCIWIEIMLLEFCFGVGVFFESKTEQPDCTIEIQTEATEMKSEPEETISTTTHEIKIEIAEPIEPVTAVPTESDKLEPYFELTPEERIEIENIVSGEAGCNSMELKMAVAQCILNTMIKEGYSPWEVRKYYQYDGYIANFQNQSAEEYAEVQEAVWRVFNNGEKVTDENILYFYAYQYCNSSWHESQKFVIEIDGCRFFAPWG